MTDSVPQKKTASFEGVLSLGKAVEFLLAQVPDPQKGLPDEVFYYVSSVTPLVNVDLLVKDELGRTLLSWRNDRFCGMGWHIPGGIVRFQEALEERVRKVADGELGTAVSFDPVPIAVKQCIHPERQKRSHFISILYKCSLPSSFEPDNSGHGPLVPGHLKWHSGCPDNLLKVHEMYRKHIEGGALR